MNVVDTFDIPPALRTPPSASSHGVTLRFFRQFVAQHQIAADRKTEELLDIVKSETADTKTSLVEKLLRGAEVGDASWFISHAWKYSFVETLEMMERFFRKEVGEEWENTVVWFDLFCGSQHAEGQQAFGTLADIFEGNLNKIGRILIVSGRDQDAVRAHGAPAPVEAASGLSWQPYSFRRVWCIFEYYSAIKANCKMEIAMSEVDENAMSQMMEGVGEHRHGSYDFFHRLRSLIDFGNADASTLTHKINIRRLVQGEEGGYAALEYRVFEAVVAVLLRKAGLYGSDIRLGEHQQVALSFILKRLFDQLASPPPLDDDPSAAAVAPSASI